MGGDSPSLVAVGRFILGYKNSSTYSMLATIKSALDGLLDVSDHIYNSSNPAGITYDATLKRIADMDTLKSELVTAIQDAFGQKTKNLKKILPELARHHNDALPINQLPPEVLGRILGFAVPRIPDQEAMDNYHLLAKVCKLWYEIIVNDPWFWPFINITVLERANMILKRNKNFPELKVWCKTPSPDQLTTFLPIIRGSSPRWTYALFDAPFVDSVKQILEGPTTRLTELYVRSTSRNPITSHQVVRISDGAPFRILGLDNLTLSWDSQRLQGPQLETLQLFNLCCRFPTLKQLHGILSASPNLKWVGFKDWTDPDAKGDFTTDNISPISLPHLETLYLGGLPAACTSHLFARLVGNKLQRIYTDEVAGSFLGLGSGVSSLNFLAGVVAKSKKLQVVLSTGGKTLRLASDPVPSINTSEWYANQKNTEGFDVTFNIQTLPHSTLQDYGDFLGLHSTAESTSLFLDAQQYATTDDSNNPIPIPAIDPKILVNAFPSVTSIQFGRYYDAGSILRHLSAPQRGPSGSYDWPWLELVTCDVRNVEGHLLVDLDLLHFSQERMRASAGSGKAENTLQTVPKALKRLLVSQKLSTVFSHVDCLKDVVKF